MKGNSEGGLLVYSGIYKYFGALHLKPFYIKSGKPMDYSFYAQKKHCVEIFG